MSVTESTNTDEGACALRLRVLFSPALIDTFFTPAAAVNRCRHRFFFFYATCRADAVALDA